MGCRCNERGRLLTAAAKAAIRGDTREVGDKIAAVVKTVKDDGRDLRTKIAAGRASLIRR